MISEALKINNTLTELNLGRDRKEKRAKKIRRLVNPEKKVK